jgi:hypothetical protein
MKLNIIDAGLVGIRLSPVLVSSHFALQSILNQDTGGVLYLTGLMFTCFIAYLFTSVLEKPTYDVEGSAQSLICKSIGIDSFSNISLSQIVLNYTLGYFSIAVCVGGNMCADRWQPIAFFIFLILSNFILEYRNGCLIAATLFLSGLIGISGGMAWAGFLKGAGYRNLPLFGGISDKITCAKAQSNIVCKR